MRTELFRRSLRHSIVSASVAGAHRCCNASDARHNHHSASRKRWVCAEEGASREFLTCDRSTVAVHTQGHLKQLSMESIKHELHHALRHIRHEFAPHGGRRGGRHDSRGAEEASEDGFDSDAWLADDGFDIDAWLDLEDSPMADVGAPSCSAAAEGKPHGDVECDVTCNKKEGLTLFGLWPCMCAAIPCFVRLPSALLPLTLLPSALLPSARLHPARPRPPRSHSPPAHAV